MTSTSPPTAGGSQAGVSDDPSERSPELPAEPVLCRHCGRTASNGISCEGACVADSGY